MTYRRRKETIFCCAFCSLSLITNKAEAQDAPCVKNIVFQVKDHSTKIPQEGVEITYKNKSAYTEENGTVILPISCDIQFQAADLEIDHLPVKAQDLMLVGDSVIVYIFSDAKHVQGTTVIAQRMQATYNSQSSLTQTELKQLKGKSIAAMASSLPGVNMLQTGPEIAKPMINGMTNNRILILNNGVRQEGQQWGAEHAPEIDAMQTEHLAVIKGAEAIRYGRDAIGGVLLISPEALPYGDKKVKGNISFLANSNGRKGIANVKLSNAFGKDGNWAWSAQSSASRAGNYKTATYFLDNTGAKSLNYSAALGYTNKAFSMEGFYSHFYNEVGIFSGSHIGDTLDLAARIKSGRPFGDGTFSYAIASPKQVVEHDLAKINLHYDLSKTWTLDALFAAQNDLRQEYDIRRQGRSSLPSLELNLKYQTAKVEAIYRKKGWNNVIGIQSDWYVNNNKPDLFTVPIIPNYDSRALGVYGIAKRAGKTVNWELGLRYDDYILNSAGYDKFNTLYGGTRNFGRLNASLGMSAHLWKGLHYYSNLGSAWRPPSVNELYSSGLHHGAAQYEIGDSTLSPEQSFKWTNSFSWQRENRFLSAQMDVYAQYFSNFIFLQPTLSFAQSLRGAFPVFDYESTKAFFWGIDLDVETDKSRQLQYGLKASIIRAKDVKNDVFLPFIPADRLSQTLRYELQTESSKPQLGFWLKNDLVAKQTRYEPNTDFAPPPNSYALFGAGASLNIKDGNRQIYMQLGVDNLFNTQYKDYLNRYRYYAHDLGRSINLQLNYSF